MKNQFSFENDFLQDEGQIVSTNKTTFCRFEVGLGVTCSNTFENHTTCSGKPTEEIYQV